MQLYSKNVFFHFAKLFKYINFSYNTFQLACFVREFNLFDSINLFGDSMFGFDNFSGAAAAKKCDNGIFICNVFPA